jgi:cytochrome c oxidase subunit II
MYLLSIPFWPDQASTYASTIDAIYGTLIALSTLFSVGVFAAIVYFAVRYRRGSLADRSNPVEGSVVLELAWTVIPLILALGMFTWAASAYFELAHPPENSMDIYATGRQWMWKVQHPTGQREINQLHIPVGQPVRVVLTSQDVLHSFYIPEFRVKQDAVPGMWTQLWFEATKPGEYRLFCAEYCGTEHSRMIGTVFAMNPEDYQNWLRTSTVQESMAQTGARLFQQYGCTGCHAGNAAVRAPLLNGIYNRPRPLMSGETVIANDMYIHDSILQPRKHVVGGYDPIMPSFAGQIPEEELMQIVYYIKSLQ